jgi:NADH dehydrogenase
VKFFTYIDWKEFQMNTNSQKHHVVIIGAGFGGLRAARALAKDPVRVTLIDRNNYHLFQPLLYQVATAGITPEEIAYPVRSIFRRQKNLEFRMAEVNEIDIHNRRLLTTGGEVYYDSLIVAAGGQTNHFGMESVAANSFGLKSLEDAVAVRNHLLHQFERAAQETNAAVRQAQLTFVIAGGGPSGVETAGAISELVQMVLAHDYGDIHRGEIQVLLLEGADQLLAAMPPVLRQKAARVLARKGVQVRFGAQVTGFDGAAVTMRGGEIIPAGTLIWTAGVRAVPLVEQLGVPLGSQGRVRLMPDLQVPGHAEIYVIGDAALLEGPDGKPLPMVAPVAIQQGEQAAANIRRALRGEAARPFAYRDPGILATIGRSQAVARLWGLSLTGFLAWLVWLGVHLMQLIGFRNRLLVLINWAWDYLFYDRAVRLILNDRPRAAPTPAPKDLFKNAGERGGLLEGPAIPQFSEERSSR